MRTLACSLVVALSGCGGPPNETATPAKVSAAPAPSPSFGPVPTPPELAPPLGRLPNDVRPTHYQLSLAIDPTKESFHGSVDVTVTLAHAKRVLWMHGRDLRVTRASVRPLSGETLAATWTQRDPGGVSSLVVDGTLGAGEATIHLEWDGDFHKALRGLYRVERQGAQYAFTQFEAIEARRAFPCFDEPAFKTPFDVTLRTPIDAVAIANTKVVSQKDGVATFARTLPLPTYLLAWAVGPLDVVAAKNVPPNEVRKRPLELRGIAAKGEGKRLAYALEHTGAILATLERWFGTEYPYDKLDVLAVPDRDGAMENAGAITFSEWLMLLDEKTAPIGQKRAFAQVMAHELAHQWFGDLVTMPWWNDVWLNEAFATWMGNRATVTWRPDTFAELQLLDRALDAMSTDALVSARAIRQPIASDHDITNAFDSITYMKGASVLGMFERWVGRDTFQSGIRAYLQAHAHGSATADDLLAALGAASGKDVATPFKTFLDRPGVPIVDVAVECGAKPTLHLTQSRYTPLGSPPRAEGEDAPPWQIPVCARWAASPKQIRSTCTLLTTKTADLALDACPLWVMPNEDASGYYRWSLAKEPLAALLGKGVASLSTRERLSVADAVRTGFSRGTARADDVLAALAPLAGDDYPSVAAAPFGLVQTAREWLFTDPLQPKVEAWGRGLYGKRWKILGWTPQKGETAERSLLRQSLLSFLAFVAQDPTVRAEAAVRGRAYVRYVDGKTKKTGKVDEKKPLGVDESAVDPNLAGAVLAVAAQVSGAPFFDHLVALLPTTVDAAVRSRILGALGAITDPELAARARALTFDPQVRVSEVMTVLGGQLATLETRDAAWTWLRENFDALVARMSPNRAGGLPYFVRYCDAAHVDEIDAFFAPRIAKLDGGPRNLRSALESMRLCAARRTAQEASVRAFFAK